jgi:hypothetical protein
MPRFQPSRHRADVSDTLAEALLSLLLNERLGKQKPMRSVHPTNAGRGRA